MALTENIVVNVNSAKCRLRKISDLLEQSWVVPMHIPRTNSYSYKFGLLSLEIAGYQIEEPTQST